MDRNVLFAYLRNDPFGGRLTQEQVDGVNATLDFCEEIGDVSDEKLAYIFATDFHESAKTMQPVIETRQPSETKNPSVDEAIRRLNKAYSKGKLPWVKTRYWLKGEDGKSWLGRGKPQLTHKANYIKAGRMIGEDLVANPELMFDLRIATKVMVLGMLRGIFTGKKLSDYFRNGLTDPIGARAVVNGQDKAEEIARYYVAFLNAIKAAKRPPKVQPSPAAAEPDDVKPTQSKEIITTGVTGLSGLGSLAFLTNIDSVWKLAAFALVLIAGGIIAYMFFTGRLTINRRKEYDTLGVNGGRGDSRLGGNVY